MRKIKTAIVGCGMISDVYMRNLTEMFQIIDLAACSDLDVERMESRAEKYHLKAAGFEDILADPEIEMVINLTSPRAHYPVIRQLLEHGKHVFSEKMIAIGLDEGRELCELAKQNHVRLGVAPDTFLGGGIQTARYIIEKGLIGDPLSAVVSLNRNYDIFGDILPHLHMAGGNIPFDAGCYFTTALASIFGPAKRVCGFAALHNPKRKNRRIGNPNLGREVLVEAENVFAASIEYKSGLLATVHMNSESLIDERSSLEIYGTEGILLMADPNTFGGPVTLKKMYGDPVSFPLTHGFQEESRGVGAAEMAWSIAEGRPHRAGMEMAYHVFELTHGMQISAREKRVYELQSDFQIPKPLPAGYMGSGSWSPTQETALMLSI